MREFFRCLLIVSFRHNTYNRLGTGFPDKHAARVSIGQNFLSFFYLHRNFRVIHHLFTVADFNIDQCLRIDTHRRRKFAQRLLPVHHGVDDFKTRKYPVPRCRVLGENYVA